MYFTKSQNELSIFGGNVLTWHFAIPPKVFKEFFKDVKPIEFIEDYLDTAQHTLLRNNIWLRKRGEEYTCKKNCEANVMGIETKVLTCLQYELWKSSSLEEILKESGPNRSRST